MKLLTKHKASWHVGKVKESQNAFAALCILFVAGMGKGEDLNTYLGRKWRMSVLLWRSEFPGCKILDYSRKL